MIPILITNNKLSKESTTLLKHAVVDYPPEGLAIPAGLRIQWKRLEDGTISYNSTKGGFMAEAVLQDDALQGVRYTWKKDGKTIRELVTFTPMQEMVLNSYTQHTQSPETQEEEEDSSAGEDFLRQLLFPDVDDQDELSESFCSLDEFEERMTPICRRCEITVMKYVKQKSTKGFVSLHSTTSLEGVYINKVNTLMARLADGSKVSFLQLSIGQILTVAEEILHM